MIYTYYNKSCLTIKITFDPLVYATPLAEGLFSEDKHYLSIDKQAISQVTVHLTESEAKEIDRAKKTYGLSTPFAMLTIYIILGHVKNLNLPLWVEMEVEERITEQVMASCGNQLASHMKNMQTSIDLGMESEKLPGLYNKVESPCDCNLASNILKAVIIHLNDRHKWTREAIADWLDELADADKIDIDFSTPDVVNFDRQAVNNPKE